MNARAGGRLTARNTDVAATSAKQASARSPARVRATPKAPNPQIAISAASPSLPSMKLNRLAPHTMANAVPAMASASGSDSPSAASVRSSAQATTSAASAWTARRSAGRTPVQSSATETAATSAHAASQTDPSGTDAGYSNATGRNPAQIASPPTRETGRSCNDRPDG